LKRIVGKIVPEDRLIWTDLGEWAVDADEGIVLLVYFEPEVEREEALKTLEKCAKLSDTKWLKPIGVPTGKWALSLKNMRGFFKSLKYFDWLKGWVDQVPEYEAEAMEDVNGSEQTRNVVRFTLKPLEVTVQRDTVGARELAPFMEQFRLDHPDPNTCAHILMDDKNGDLHRAIANAVKKTCSLQGIEALLAHEKNYPLLLTENISYTELMSERKRYAELPPEEREELESLVEEKSETDLVYNNILTYIQGCGFCVAAIDRQSYEDCDFSVPFLAGYAIAKGKPVCLLKDKSLNAPGKDLFGHTYVEFDSSNPEETVSEALENWLDEEDLIG
jgi:nucleoside 2-deoxyribosyltransferase